MQVNNLKVLLRVVGTLGLGGALGWPRMARAEQPVLSGQDVVVAAPTTSSHQPLPPRIEFTPEVIYPMDQAGTGISGRVTLQVTVDIDGTARDVQVVESLGESFDRAALELITGFRFHPAEVKGQKVAARVLVPIEFTAPAVAKEARPSDEGPWGSAVSSSPPEPERPVPASVRGDLRTPASSSASSAQDSEPVEVLVQGEMSATERLEKSADAVTVVRLATAKRRSGDMADVLSRTPGMVVRRSGGLGSDVRFSINGLYGSAVRLFVDGVPIEMSGQPRNVGSISVNLIDHVEIYRGVVPLRLAADALGGAINFVTEPSFEDRVSLSFLEGSFGTQRASALAQYRHSSGFVLRATGYADRARNDYVADVQVPDDEGQLSPAQVRLKNNEYSAVGGSLEAGVVDKKWAERLLVRAYYSGSAREYGHNLVMSVPYGEVRQGDASGGGQVSYQVRPSRSTRLEHITNLSHRALSFLDASDWVYDWYGQRIRSRRVAGEIESRAYDLTIWDNMVFSRTLLEWTPDAQHTLLFNVTPKFTTRTGDERRQLDPDARDPLTARNDVLSVVVGAGHEWNWGILAGAPQNLRGASSRLQNIANIKGYLYALWAEEPLPGGTFRVRDRSSVSFGVADSLRYALNREWSLKASYEYATRLPDSWEVFGDGSRVQSNLELEPEVSHNVNLGPLYDARDTALGDFSAFANGGLRDTDRMIVLLGTDRYYRYQNVYRALTLFGEGGLSWTSPGRYLSLDGSATWNDTRNQSDSGVFADFKGDRIPNRPPFSLSWAARCSFKGVFLPGDRLEPFYQGRFTEGFFRGWESQGLQAFKQRIGDQAWHDAGLTYVVSTRHTRISNTFEVQNLTNERLYEYFGQQRPGRAFYWKLTADFN